MECRPLEITVTSAKDLKDVNVFGKMDVYCVVSVKGDVYNSKQKQKTHVHKDSGPNPVWNFPMKFTIDDAAAAQQSRIKIKFKLKAERMMGDKDVGVVFVPVKELLDAKDGKGSLSYSVKTPTGKMKGTLNFLFNFGEKFNVPAPAMSTKMDKNVAAYPSMGYHAAAGGKEMDKPVTAYPIMGYQAAPVPMVYQGTAGASSAYPVPPPQAAGDKHQAPYPYPSPYQYPPPPQYGYGGYPPAPGQGYPGYPPQPGYGGYPPVMQPQKPKKSGKGNMALGLGAGLLGGLLVGDMISDVGEMAAYDAGFDDGIDF